MAQFSLILLLTGLALLEDVGVSAWVSMLTVGGYLLTFVLSFAQRRRILRVLVQGWSTDSRWGRWMFHLALIGPAAGASLGSGIGLFLVRLHVLPESILIASAGLVGNLMAAIIVPQVVQDFSVAWIHLQTHRAEADQAAEKG